MNRLICDTRPATQTDEDPFLQGFNRPLTKLNAVIPYDCLVIMHDHPDIVVVW